LPDRIREGDGDETNNGGLTFSGIAKLFFIPVIYEMWFDHKSDHDEHPQLTDDYRASFEAIK
jgi:hypothetical protein